MASNRVSKWIMRGVPALMLLFIDACVDGGGGDLGVRTNELERHTLSLAPGFGADLHVTPDSPNTVFFQDDSLVVSDSDAHVLVAFPTTAIEDALGVETLVGATLTLTARPGWSCSGIDEAFAVHRLTQPFVEDESSWNCQEDEDRFSQTVNCTPPDGADWSMEGPTFPYETDPISTTRCEEDADGTRLVFQVGQDLRRALESSDPFHGWLVRVRDGLRGKLHLYSADSTDAERHELPLLQLFSLPEGYGPELDPATLPPLDVSTVTSVFEQWRFLLDASRGLQWGFEGESVFDRDRVSVIRGLVRARDAAGQDDGALAGATVRVLGHPELGETRTRSDGMFDLMVNGGGSLTIEFVRAGRLMAQRTVDVPWGTVAWTPDVGLVPEPTTCLNVTPSTRFLEGPSSGPPEPGDRDSRQPSMWIPPSTQVRDGPGGSWASAFEVCVGEYTLEPSGGRAGEEAMPGELPGTTAYTFAIEARVTGREHAQFDRDVYAYVENFLGFGVGEVVPSGFYDTEQAAWMPSANGSIIRVVDNVTGCSVEGEAALVVAINATTEPAALCAQYDDGDELWRVPLRHFSSLDFNWPALFDFLGGEPDPDVDDPQPPADPCAKDGSIIYCESHTLGEAHAITGSPFALRYFSHRQRGRFDAYNVSIQPFPPGSISNDDFAALDEVRIEIHVAGRRMSYTLAPAFFAADQAIRWSLADTTDGPWDGRDAFGRFTQGPQRATVRVGYVFTPPYRSAGDTSGSPPAFGSDARGESLGASRSVVLWRTRRVSMGTVDEGRRSIGGWNIDAHHVYDPMNRTLYLGTGQHRTVESVGLIATTVHSSLPAPTAVAAASDGTIYYSSESSSRGQVWRRPRGGAGAAAIIGHPTAGTETDTACTSDAVCGAGHICTGQDTGVTGVCTANPLAVRLRFTGVNDSPYIGASRDGRVYVADYGHHCVRMYTPASGSVPARIQTIVGVCNTTLVGTDLEHPRAARLLTPRGLAVGADGSVYIADTGNHRILRFRWDGTSDGRVDVFMGATSTCTDRPSCMSTPTPRAVAVGPDGSVFVSISSPHRIRRVRPDATVETIAGGGIDQSDGVEATSAECGKITGLSIGSDGVVYYSEFGDTGTNTYSRVRRITTDGHVYTLAGQRDAVDLDNLTAGAAGDGLPATRVDVLYAQGVAWSAEGVVYYADRTANRLRVVGPAYEGGLLNEHTIPSEDGSMLYDFSAEGRHLRTRDALTNAELVAFEYRSDGKLRRIYDSEGQLTQIQLGTSTTHVDAPGGSRTHVSLTGGYVSRIADPANVNAHTFLYESMAGTRPQPGLLTHTTDARGYSHDFTYDDERGWLLTDRDPLLHSQTLVSTGEDDMELQSPEGRVQHFEQDRTETGLTRRIGNARATTTTFRPFDGRGATRSSWDGTSSTSTVSPDPIYGMQSPFVSAQEVVRPAVDGSGAITTSVARTRTRTATSLVETAAINGGGIFTVSTTRPVADWVTTIDPPSGTARRTTITRDAERRTTRIQLPGQHPICVTYGTSTTRRPQTIRQSSGCSPTASTRREVTYTYDTGGRRWLLSVQQGYGVDAMLTSITPDVRGWTDTATLPGRADALDLSYDEHGNLVAVQPPDALSHSFGFSPRDEPVSYTPPGTSDWPSGAETSVTYSPDSLAATVTLRGGARTLTPTFAPDTNYLDALDGGDDGTFTFTNDDGGRPTAITFEPTAGGTPGVAVTLGATYQGAVLRTESWSGPFAADVVHDVAASALLASQTVTVPGASMPISRVISYGYDGDRVPNAVAVAGTNGASETMTITPVAGPKTNIQVNATRTSASDGIDQLTVASAFGELERTTAYRRSGGLASAPLYQVDVFERDVHGRIKAREERMGSTYVTYRYTYDEAGRLHEYRRFPCARTAICTPTLATATYDQNGNRSDIEANNADQPKVGGREYDGTGRLSARTVSGAAQSFNYDRFGRLRQFVAGSTTITYSYDAADRLVLVDYGNGEIERFIYRDGIEPIAWQHRTSASSDLRTVLFAYGSNPHTPDLMFVDNTSDGVLDDTLRVLSDERGSVRAVYSLPVSSTNPTSLMLVQRIRYDVWGNAILEIGADSVQPFRFGGGIWLRHRAADPTGATTRSPRLVRFGARDYDPAIGRWTAPDPIRFGGGLNMYAYAGNDPVNRVDPSGLFAFVCTRHNYLTGQTDVLIRIPIDFHGDGYDAAYKRLVVDEIERRLSGSIGSYDVETRVIGPGPNPAQYNRVRAPQANSIGGGYLAQTRHGGGWMGSVWPAATTDGATAAHEAGHLLGLPHDRNDPGNLMWPNDRGGDGLTPDQIAAIVDFNAASGCGGCAGF